MPAPFPYSRPWRGLPLALLAISRILDKEGYEIKIISRFLSDCPEEEILREAEDSLCLGISAMVGFQIQDGLRLAGLVREKYPDLPIVWGGWHSSVLPEQTAQSPLVDIVIKGQGERTFTELVHALEKGRSLKGISGLVYKDRGKVIVNPDRLPEDINNFPSLPYHLVDMEKCITGTEPGERGILYSSSYGCPFRCGFCVEPIVCGRHWTGLKAERVVEDWEYLVKKYRINTIVLADSNFFVDKKRVYGICRGLLKKGLKLKWKHANARVSQLVGYEREVWEAMRKSGCTLINTGAESGSQEALDLIEKDMKVEEIEKFTRLCREHDIKVQFSFLMGLPWSKSREKNQKFIEKEYQATFVLINKLLEISRRNRFTYYVYLPYPGSSLFKRAVKLGLKTPASLEGWSRYLLSPDDAFKTVLGQKWISPQQARLVNMLSQYIFAVMDSDTLKLIKRTPGKLKREVLIFIYRMARKMVEFRWQYKYFGFPLDFWFFILIRQHGKLE